MRIALLSFEYPPDTGFGGIGTYTWYQARALARLGHDVHVLAGATEPTGTLRHSEHDGVRVHRFRAGGAPMRMLQSLDGPRLWWTKNRLGNAWSFLRGFDQLLERHGFDVVEFPECGGEGALLAPLRDVPAVVKFHSPARLIMGCYDVRAEDMPITSLIERVGIEHARGHLSCSRFAADEIRRAMGFARPIEVVANGIDLSLFDAEEPLDVRAHYGLPKDRQLVLFCGRMESRKGIEVCPPIVTAVLERHDAAFVFAGDDLFGFVEREFKPALAARSLRGSCHFLGRIPLAHARALARQSDVFFMPSRWENCPYACLEAMAASRAVLAARSSGIPELVVDGDSGLLASLDRPDEFVRGLERLLGDRPLRERLGAAARRRIEDHYTDVRIAHRTVDCYRRLLRDPARLARPAPVWHGELVEAIAAVSA
ncbi:MAG: glycosyltransferase family 4 protein, partial [Planctomycetota bacterium]